MAGSFGILIFVLFIGASNLALGYAAAVYFGKARLELVWISWQLTALNPLAWFGRKAEAHAAWDRDEDLLQEPFPETPIAEHPPTPARRPAKAAVAEKPKPVEATASVPDAAEQEHEPQPKPKHAAPPAPVVAATPEIQAPGPAATPSAAAGPGALDLEASLSAYAAAAARDSRAAAAPVPEEETDHEAPEPFGPLPGEEAEALGPPPSFEEIAPEAWAFSEAEESRASEDAEEEHTEAGLSKLLDNLVAENLSELEDAFARIDQCPGSAVAAGAREPEAVGVH